MNLSLIVGVVLFGFVGITSVSAQQKDPTKNISKKETTEKESLLKALKEKAINGDIESQYQLGVKYLKGKDVKQDSDEAVKWLLMAANKKYEGAEYLCGMCFTYGWGVSKNPQAAVRLLNKTVNPDDVGQVKVIWDAYKQIFDAKYFSREEVMLPTSEAKKAIDWTLLAADKGITEAQTLAAGFYYEGVGVSKDVSKAAKLARAAAKKGDNLASQFADQYEYEAMNPVQKWFADREKAKAHEQQKKKAEEFRKKAKENEVADLLREIRDQNAELLEAVRESSEQSASRPDVVYVNDNSGDDLRREFKDSVDDLRNDIDRAAMWDAMQSRLHSE